MWTRTSTARCDCMQKGACCLFLLPYEAAQAMALKQPENTVRPEQSMQLNRLVRL